MCQAISITENEHLSDSKSDKKVQNELHKDAYANLLKSQELDFSNSLAGNNLVISGLLPDLSIVDKSKIVEVKPIEERLQRDAEAIRKATGNDNWIFTHADRDQINKILENKTEAEIRDIDKAYRQKYHKGLEEEMRGFEKGDDLDKFLNVLHKKDNNIAYENAGRIHEMLLERGNIIEGRSNAQLEKEIRDTLATQPAEQIKKIDQEYRELSKKRFGKEIGLEEALGSDPNLSQATKDAVAIYLKRGSDQRTDEDTLTLSKIALKNRNLDMFEGAMRDASQSARDKFMQANGEQELKNTFLARTIVMPWIMPSMANWIPSLR